MGALEELQAKFDCEVSPASRTPTGECGAVADDDPVGLGGDRCSSLRAEATTSQVSTTSTQSLGWLLLTH